MDLNAKVIFDHVSDSEEDFEDWILDTNEAFPRIQEIPANFTRQVSIELQYMRVFLIVRQQRLVPLIQAYR